MSDQAGTVTAGGTGSTYVISEDGTRSTTLAPGESAPFNMTDELVTDPGARARGVMGDGSVLNVGSGASMQVLPHDSSPQRSLLERIYGNFRSWTVEIFGGGGSGGGGGGGGVVGGVVGMGIGISSKFGDDMYGDLEWDGWMT